MEFYMWYADVLLHKGLVAQPKISSTIHCGNFGLCLSLVTATPNMEISINWKPHALGKKFSWSSLAPTSSSTLPFYLLQSILC